MISVLVRADAALHGVAAQRQAARRMLAAALRNAFALDAKDIQFTTNAFGKPLIEGHPGVHFNVSHCAGVEGGGAVAVVVADHRVGIDIEAIRPWDRYAGARMLAPEELARVADADDTDREFFRHWTLKESYVKALGAGLAYPVRRLRAQPGPAGRATMNVPRATLRLHETLFGFVLATCSLRGVRNDAEPLVVRLGG